MEVLSWSTEVIIYFARNVIIFNLSVGSAAENKQHLTLESTRNEFPLPFVAHQVLLVKRTCRRHLWKGSNQTRATNLTMLKVTGLTGMIFAGIVLYISD